jgi:hypothetical protein
MASDNEHWRIYCQARTPKGAVNWRATGQAKKRFALDQLPYAYDRIHYARATARFEQAKSAAGPSCI